MEKLVFDFFSKVFTSTALYMTRTGTGSRSGLSDSSFLRPVRGRPCLIEAGRPSLSDSWFLQPVHGRSCLMTIRSAVGSVRLIRSCGHPFFFLAAAVCWYPRRYIYELFSSAIFSCCHPGKCAWVASSLLNLSRFARAIGYVQDQGTLTRRDGTGSWSRPVCS